MAACLTIACGPIGRPCREPFAGLPTGLRWVPVLTGESGTSVFRRSDNAVYAKCSTSGAVQELAGERERNDWLASNDIAGPALLSWAQSELGACLIITAVPGIPAADLSLPELREAWPSIVRTLRMVHDRPVAGCPFERRLTTMLNRAEDVIQRRAVNPEFLLPEQRQTAHPYFFNVSAPRPGSSPPGRRGPPRLPRRRMPTELHR